MRHFGNSYEIYRVFGAGTNKAWISRIVNPAKQILEGKILINAAEIKIWSFLLTYSFSFLSSNLTWSSQYEKMCLQKDI